MSFCRAASRRPDPQPATVDLHRRHLTVHIALTHFISADNLKAMQDALLDAGSVRTRVPIDEHYTTEFTPVRL